MKKIFSLLLVAVAVCGFTLGCSQGGGDSAPAPTPEAEAPAEGEEAPAEGEEAPAEGEEAPAEG